MTTATTPPSAHSPGIAGTADFAYHATPGRGIFYILGTAYAPPMDDVPAQYFMGEWTGDDRGCEIAVWEPDTGRWHRIPFQGLQITSHLWTDPFRPVVYMSGPRSLYAIDRRTLTAEPVAELPRKYTADFDSRGNLWIAHERHLWRFNPDSQQLTHYPEVTDPRFYYPDGTHMVLGIGPDDRIWISQGPKANVSIFDPTTGKAAAVWSADDLGRTDQRHALGMGTPLVIGDIVCVGALRLDAASGKPLDESPIPVEVQPYMAMTWEHTPSRLVPRGGRVPVLHEDRRFGWMDPASYAIDWVATLPDVFAKPIHIAHRAVHGDHTLLAADKTAVHSFDLRTGRHERHPLGVAFEHPQAMFAWNVGLDHAIYASAYSHELLQVNPRGELTNFGNIVNIFGGELWGFAFQPSKVWVISYTGSILTRVDLTRPANHWGPDADNNPRHILDLRHTGQHRPTAVDIAPDGRLYYISRSDYCARREGALIIVDTATEAVQQVVDPLIPGEQLWGLACSPTRPEIYLATGRGTFIVWDTRSNRIARTIRLPQHPGDGEMTSAGIHTGGVRFLAAAGDSVIGNQWGSMTWFTYHADTGEMEMSRPHPAGRVFGVYRWPARDSFVLNISGNLYETDPRTGQCNLLYQGPIPGPYPRFGPDGRIYLSDNTHIFVERRPIADAATATCERAGSTAPSGIVP